MRSAKASPMATSLTFLSALSAWEAAPVPRPPQPMRPIFSTSLPAACAFCAIASCEAAMAAADVLRKSRREDCIGPPKRKTLLRSVAKRLLGKWVQLDVAEQHL